MYDVYRTILTRKEYFKNWGSKSNELPEEIKEVIYKRYLEKAITFQNAGFKCENEFCESPNSKLTYHHIRMAKNGGKFTHKNGACVCNACQKGYHSAKKSLKIRGKTYKLHESIMREKDEYPDEIDFKVLKKQQKNLRKQNKQFHGIRISWELMKLLMEFLFGELRD